MVDFTRVHAITASDSIAINDALEMMRVNRIRALMVIDCNGEFAGIVTAMDLMGRKPMAYANEAGIPHSQVQVRDIMSSKNKLKAIARADVDKATLADVLEVLRSLNQQHILVVEGGDEDMRICGLFSVSDFKRALGISLETAEVAHTFSDLERIINENKEVM
jgi:CBS-domain-containing membrane protein